MGEDFEEILQAHVLPRHAVVAFPAAHLAPQGAAVVSSICQAE